MPKRAPHTLSWSTEQNAYTLCMQGKQHVLQLQRDDSAWFAWLTIHTSFSFHGQQGRLSLLKEARTRGKEGYWYAYRRQGQRVIKQYAGRTPDLTLAHLERLAHISQTPSNEGSRGVEWNRGAQENALQIGSATARNCFNETHHAYPFTHSPSLAAPCETLLFSKLRPPRLAFPLLQRARLVTQLDAGLEHKLTLVQAPAGFGKTTLLAQWFLHRHQGVAWLSLDRAENEPGRFLVALLTAVCSAYPDHGLDCVTIPHLKKPEALRSALIVVFNVLAASPEKIILVLDDYQTIENPVLHDALTFLLEHLPNNIHLIIASRCEPPFHLARLRATGQLSELRASALRFTLAEMEQLLISVLDIKLATEELAVLAERTEGWGAGLQLTALVLHEQPDPARVIMTLTETHRYITTYLIEEVLESQPAQVQSFLLQTALFECVNASLCTAVVGDTHASRMLEYLEQTDLFLSPCETHAGWYRYQPLFRAALHRHLEQTQPEILAVLHARASHWFEEHGQISEAIEHALAANDRQRAGTLIELVAPTLFAHGEIITLQGWLAALPDSVIHASPRLCITAAWLLFLTSQSELFLDFVDGAERALLLQQEILTASTAARLRIEVVTLRAISAFISNDFAGAIAICRQALQALPTENLYLHGLVLLILGLASFQGVGVGAGAQAIAEASNHLHVTGHALLIPYVLAIQAELYIAQGHSTQAANLYQQILTLATGQSASSAFAAGLAHVGLGCLAWEWNQIEEARQHLLQSWDLSTRARVSNTRLLSALMLSLVFQAQNKPETANLWLHRARGLCQRSGPLNIVQSCQTRLHLATGRIEEALLWLQECQDDLMQPGNKHSEFEKLTLARVLIAAARAHNDQTSIQRVLALLEHLRTAAEQAERIRSLVEIQALTALALDLHGKREAALSLLERAVSLARQGKYLRVFLDEGEPMVRLLRSLLARRRSQKTPEQKYALAYLTCLLKAFAHPEASLVPSRSGAQEVLCNPLSSREREVLRLLAAGHKNREIADELVVVLGTVKAHINAIYQKLGVSSRVQAVLRARALGLL